MERREGESEPRGPSGPLARLRAFASRRSEFTRNVAKVSAGQVGRTLVSLLAIPVVTRLYAAEHFGSLQLLISVIATFAAVGSLKYEMAIVLPQDRAESNRATVLSLLVLAAVCGLVTVVQLSVGDEILGFFRAEALRPWALLVPLGVLLVGLVKVGQYALIAGRRFGSLSRNNVAQVAATQGLSIGWGLWHPSFLGLFLSRMIGSALAVGLAFRLAPPRLGEVTAKELRRVARKYWKFPTVNTVGVLFNTLALELPVFMLARFFEAEVVGYYMLTLRLLDQPLQLVGQAVSKVYLQAAASAEQTSARTLFALYRSTVLRLAVVGLVPVAAVLLAAEPLVSLVLGAEWAPVARYMELLLLWKYFQFITTPVSTTFSVVNRQEIGVVLMVLSAGLRLGAMLYWSGSPEAMLLALSAAAALYSLAYNGASFALLAYRSRREAAGAT